MVYNTLAMEKLTIDFAKYTFTHKTKAKSQYADLIGQITDRLNEERRKPETQEENKKRFTKWVNSEKDRAKTLKRKGWFYKVIDKHGYNTPEFWEECKKRFQKSKHCIKELEYSTVAVMLKGWKTELYYLHDICSKSNNYSACFFKEIKKV